MYSANVLHQTDAIKSPQFPHMKVEKTKLDEVILIRLDPLRDFRGMYLETYNEELYKKNGIDIHFVQDDISISSKHVLRGLHGDSDTWKLVSCLTGAFYLVVVNCDKESVNFAKWQGFTLSRENAHQVLVPPKHANGHVVLTDEAIFHYKQSTYYAPEKQFSYTWDDPQFNIWWPIKNPILSQRDELGKMV
jgi:dTDP-4-dehydrorhamnose 3,5-epimerase